MLSNEYIAMMMHQIRESEIKHDVRRGRNHNEIVEEFKREELRARKNKRK